MTGPVPSRRVDKERFGSGSESGRVRGAVALQEGRRWYYGQVVGGLEKEDNVNWEDGGKDKERRWNIGMNIQLINNLRKNLNSRIEFKPSS